MQKYIFMPFPFREKHKRRIHHKCCAKRLHLFTLHLLSYLSIHYGWRQILHPAFTLAICIHPLPFLRWSPLTRVKTKVKVAHSPITHYYITSYIKSEEMKIKSENFMEKCTKFVINHYYKYTPYLFLSTSDIKKSIIGTDFTFPYVLKCTDFSWQVWLLKQYKLTTEVYGI